MIQKESDAILSTYRHFFDVVLVNNDVDESVKGVEEAIEHATSTPQWVPVSWVYWRTLSLSFIPHRLSKSSAISLLTPNLWVSDVLCVFYLDAFLSQRLFCTEVVKISNMLISEPHRGCFTRLFDIRASYFRGAVCLFKIDAKQDHDCEGNYQILSREKARLKVIRFLSSLPVRFGDSSLILSVWRHTVSSAQSLSDNSDSLPDLWRWIWSNLYTSRGYCKGTFQQQQQKQNNKMVFPLVLRFLPVLFFSLSQAAVNKFRRLYWEKNVLGLSILSNNFGFYRKKEKYYWTFQIKKGPDFTDGLHVVHHLSFKTFELNSTRVKKQQSYTTSWTFLLDVLSISWTWPSATTT